MTDTVTTFAGTDRQVFTQGIDTHSTDARQGNITDEGIELIKKFHTKVGNELASNDPEFFDGLQYWTASLGRYIIEFPDEYVKNQYQETPYPTFYVVKIDSQGGDANSEIWREITTWQHMYDTELNNLIAPVDAWGANAEWCVMRRVYAPTEASHRADSGDMVQEMVNQIMNGDMSAEEMMEATKNTHPGDHDGIPHNAYPLNIVEDALHEWGFTIQDPEENCGYDHSINKTCFFDMGGFRHNDVQLSDVDIFNTDDSNPNLDSDPESEVDNSKVDTNVSTTQETDLTDFC